MNIQVTGTVIILTNYQTVFDYISNLENDPFWRKEINATMMTSKPQIDALAIENSYLSVRTPNNILKFICTEFTENKQIVYQTLPDSKFFLKSDRTVEPISQKETKVIYTITFDKAIVKHGLGFTLPTFMVDWVAKHDMKKYLTKLKSVLENADK
jgi:hypothetical protein